MCIKTIAMSINIIRLSENDKNDAEMEGATRCEAVATAMRETETEERNLLNINCRKQTTLRQTGFSPLSPLATTHRIYIHTNIYFYYI